MATFTKAQLRRIIKEEYEAVMNEDSGTFGSRSYDHSSEATPQPVAEDNARNKTSRMITKLELVLSTVDGAMGYIENPAAEERFQKALDIGQELWEEMHDLLGEGKKKADHDDGEE